MSDTGRFPDGEFVYCQDCRAPIVLFNQHGSGYTLICGCGHRRVSLSAETQSSTLFEPVTGLWSHVDDVEKPEYPTEDE